MELKKLLEVMDTLLGENGCPWDKEQTHETLRENMLEEANEAVEAINSADPAAICEELGDVLLQVVFHAKIAEKNGTFTLADVITGITNKLISRHTHVFGGDTALSAEDALAIWKANKAKEKLRNC